MLVDRLAEEGFRSLGSLDLFDAARGEGEEAREEDMMLVERFAIMEGRRCGFDDLEA